VTTSPELTYQHPALSEMRPPARARASLVFEVAGKVSAFALEEGPGLVVGRSPPADVVIEDKSLSRSHARFTLRDGLVYVEDLGSTNGVRLEGEKVESCALDDTDNVELGSVRVIVSGLAGPVSTGAVGGFADFRRALESEIERARTFGRPFCLLGVCSPSPELAFTLGANLRVVDVATSYMPDLVLVVLPETTAAGGAELAHGLIKRLDASSRISLVVYPEDAADFEDIIERAVHAARVVQAGTIVRASSETREADTKSPVIVSPAMQRMYALVERVARATMPVLVLGETGAGKELASRAVHERSPRAKGPFVAINCASIPSGLIESVLFGHEKGAFTGAIDKRLGVFEQAHGGSVFLDEVGELTLAVQAALLRVLETKRLSRVGSPKELEVDVRVIAATHRDLPAMVAAGTFREDLMFRLDALSLRVPPLRERVEEVDPLAERFLSGAREQWHLPVHGISDDARAALRAYHWPGNVRQLKNVIERAAVVCTAPEIGVEDLPESITGRRPAELDVPAPRGLSAPVERKFGPLIENDVNIAFNERIAAFEARVIREALAKTAGNQTKAAAMLKIPRRTLTNKIHALGIEAKEG
jgi:two-component system response regulator AtoC